MRIFLTLPVLTAGLLGSALAGDEPMAPSGDLELTYKAHRNWTVLLPQERFSKVGSEFPFAHAGGTGFGVEMKGSTLSIDTDGDGATDLDVLPKDAEEGKVVTVTFRGKSATGGDVTHSVRLVNQGGWQFAPSSSMAGKIGETKIQVIDQNNDGTFDDYGHDAMIVGRGEVASYLSRVVNVAGNLYTIDVAADGSSLSYSPYEGAAGTLDFHSGYQTKAKLKAVIVKSGEHSFDLSKAKKGMRVPAGDYALTSGLVVLGGGDATIGTGRSRPITVEPDEKAVFEWGGPLDAEFAFERSGGQVAFSPDQVWYYGGGGEVYQGWNPRGKSPEFAIKEKNTGEVLVNAKFPGSC